MSREIRFMAWLKLENKMVDVEGIYFDKPGLRIKHEYILDSKNPFNKGYPNTNKEDMILLQFTGLKDKNGKEIYEGDILKIIRVNWYCPRHPKNNTDVVDQVEVYWDEERNAISTRTFDFERLKRNPNQRPYCSSGLLGSGWNDERADENIWEVIGNIYENPELLEDDA